MFFKTFQTVDVSYSDATYRYEKASSLGVFVQMGKEILKKRMPSPRVWNLFHLKGKCTAITDGVPKTGPEKPYDSYVVTKLAFMPKAEAGAKAVTSEIDRALLFFGNVSVSQQGPALSLVVGKTETVLPQEPKARAQKIASLYQPNA